MGKRGVNKVILVGNLGDDPEVKFMPSGDAVANLSLATSETWKDKQTGEQKEKSEWHRIAIFGKLAEIAGEYLKKGSKVYFEGKLQTRKWQDQSGNDRYTTEVIVDSFDGEMQMLGGNQVQGQNQQQAAPQQQGGFNQNQSQQGGGYSNHAQHQSAPQQQGGYSQQQASPSQNLAAKRQQAQSERQQAPQQQGGYNQQQAAPQQQGGYNQQQSAPQQNAHKVNPQEPAIDFDDDIPF